MGPHKQHQHGESFPCSCGTYEELVSGCQLSLIYDNFLFGLEVNTVILPFPVYLVVWGAKRCKYSSSLRKYLD
jgi:hypothetical protein